MVAREVANISTPTRRRKLGDFDLEGKEPGSQIVYAHESYRPSYRVKHSRGRAWRLPL